MKPVKWINRAVQVTQSFSRTHSGNHYLYIVLLEKVPDIADGNALYVGQTAINPEKRLENHKSGQKASRWVRKYGTRLLPNLYSHLIPLQREEAERLEYEIAEALKKEGIPVYGGH